MKHWITTMTLVWAFTGLLGLLPTTTWANDPPVVSNVTASQRTDGSRIVDINYDLSDADSDPCTVWVVVSDDGGGTFKVKAQTFSGDVGAGVLPGTGKHVVWYAGSDVFGEVLPNAKVRVYADDGNGLAPMVLVPGGWFQMGDPWNEGNADERPVHSVWVSTFRIDKYEVANALYVLFLNTGGNDDHWSANQKIVRQGQPGSYFYTLVSGFEIHPVVYVNWTDAMHFCDWRSTVEGLPTGTYRLPTEAEWEKAAGWDPVQQRHFRFGEHTDGCEPPPSCLDGHRANYLDSGDPFDNGTTPVGYYDGTTHGSYTTQDGKSYYGAYDMSGNVWDRCYDWYSSTYYTDSPDTDPTGPTSGTWRVLRGAGLDHTPDLLRSASRNGNSASLRNHNLGFRCVGGDSVVLCTLDLSSFGGVQG